MKKLILFATLNVCCCLVRAQNFAWARSLGGSSYENGVSIVTDAAGNIYTVGNYSLTADFDPGPGVFNLTSAGLLDVFISKMDPAGNFIWAKSIGGISVDQVRGMAIDFAGNLYVTGIFALTVDFDPSAASYSLSSEIGSNDVFVLKLDGSGSFQWAKAIGGSGQDNVICFNLTNLGYVYMTGTYQGLVDFDPSAGGTFQLTSGGPYILKLDLSGNFVWAKNTNQQISAFDLDSQDNMYMAGSFYAPIDFDPGPGTFTLGPTGPPDGYLCKLNTSGDFVWANKIGGPGFEQIQAVEVDNSNNVVVAGFFDDVVDFDPGPGTYTLNNPNFDPFVCKWSAAGNFIWARNLEGTGMYVSYLSVATNSTGNVHLAGSFTGGIDFDPGPGTYSLVSNGGNDIYVLKLDVSGNFIWAGSVGGPSGDNGASLNLNSNGDMIVTGSYSSTVDFDPGATTYSLTASGSLDAFVLKLSNNENITALEENAGGGAVSIYPNPAHEAVSLGNYKASDPDYRITDLAGRPVWSGHLATGNMLDISGLAPGVYLLQLGSLAGKPVKLIKQ